MAGARPFIFVPLLIARKSWQIANFSYLCFTFKSNGLGTKPLLMLIINGRLLDKFALTHASARKSLATWKKATMEATWKMKQDLLFSFPNAKVLKQNRARFEIQHNKYRMIAEIFYDDGIVKIRFIGTHAEYNKIDPLTI